MESWTPENRWSRNHSPKTRSNIALLVISAALLALCMSCNKPLPAESVQLVASTPSVTITDVRFPTTAIGGLLWYRAIVPAVSPGERLPVLYLLRGSNSDPAEVQQRSGAVELAIASRLIVILPEAGYSYYTNAKHRRHARWEDAIALDLPRDVESRFPVLPGRAHRGIAGISMGGYGAVKLSLKHPDLYAFAANMSGSLDITRRPTSLKRWGQSWMIWTTFGLTQAERNKEDVFELIDQAASVDNIQWFESCGMADPLYDVNARFLHHLHQHGVVLDGISSPGFHDWETWGATMPAMFHAAGEALR